MIRESSLHERMRLLLACRTFDLETDHRLGRLCQKGGPVTKVVVGELAEEDIYDVLRQLGYNAEQLSKEQKKLLAVPLHLELLSQIIKSGKDVNVSIGSAATIWDLYNQYWNHKMQVLHSRLGSIDSLSAMIEQLQSRMMDDLALTDAGFFEDKYPVELSSLVSEGVLVRNGPRVAFFHETLFDYRFARQFMNRRKDLCDFLRANDQHLFASYRTPSADIRSTGRLFTIFEVAAGAPKFR